MTQQGDRQASVRAITGTALTYEGDFMAMFDGAGIAAGDFDGRFLAWINKTLGATYTEINGAMQAYAATFGAANWSSLGSLDPYPGATAALDFVGPAVAGLPFYKFNGVVYPALSSVPGWTFTRASSKTAQNSAGQVLSFGSGVPAITDLGFLVEAASTNLLPNSNGFTSWTVLSGVSAAQNATGPDGAATGWTLTQTGANGSDSRAQNNTTVANDGTAYACSIYIPKSASAPTAFPAVGMGLVGGTGVSVTAVVNPQTGAILFANGSVGSVASAGNFWRVQVSVTNNTTGNTTLFASYYPAWNSVFSTTQSTVNGGATGAAFAQVEVGTSATSYIPTAGAAATRAADVPMLTAYSLPAAGTVLCDYTMPQNPALSRCYLYGIVDGGFSRFNVRGVDLSGNLPTFVVGDGVANANLGPVNVLTGQIAKTALAYDTTSPQLGAATNGVDATSATQAVVALTTPNNFGIGTNVGAGQLGGYIKRLVIMPRFYSAAQRIAVTQ